jgi:FkbM family methyltransferase
MCIWACFKAGIAQNPGNMNLMLRAYAALFARPAARRLNYILFDCATRGVGIMNYHSLSASGEAHFIQKFLPSRLSATPVILDVGANIGDYTALLRDQFPGALIHAFEPNPECFAQLKLRQSELTVCRPFGFSHSRGEVDLYLPCSEPTSQHASLYQDVIEVLHGQSAHAIRARMETLDDYLVEQKLARVDFLKIDTEGSELAVLKGARRALAERRIGIIQFEFNEMNIVSRCFLRDFRAVLPHHEFSRLVRSGLLKIPQTPLRSELFAFQNIVALPKPEDA